MEVRKADLLTRIALGCGLALSIASASLVLAASTEHHKSNRPDLFNETNGLRIDRYRAPIPDDVPGGHRVSATDVRKMLKGSAVAIDVFGAPQSRFDELDGTWMVREPRMSLPGAVWLPEVGRGMVSEDIAAYLESNLAQVTNDDMTCPVIIFCVADCWMSWNAVQRIAALGYTKVYWFAEGVDGWLDEGWSLSPVDPVPVQLD